MMIRPRLRGFPRFGPLTAAAALLCLALFASGAGAQDAIARVDVLRGAASAEMPGQAPRPLRAGDDLRQGERVSTEADGALKLVFRDNTVFYLGARTAMVVEGYSAEAAEPRFVARLTRGVFRYVSGLIARSQPRAVAIRTPVATIGIRGTHFGGETDGSSATIVLLEAQGEAVNAIEVSNAQGRVAIDEAGHGTEIPDADSPPGTPRRMRLRAVENLIRSLSALPRLPGPRLH